MPGALHASAPKPIDQLPDWIDREPATPSEQLARDSVIQSLAITPTTSSAGSPVRFSNGATTIRPIPAALPVAFATPRSSRPHWATKQSSAQVATERPTTAAS